jgi:hypothetical protein
MTDPIRTVLDRLEGVQRNGDRWTARCPAHDDRTPSLSIGEGDDGRALLKCHKGCETEEIVREAGLSMRDLFSDDVDTSWSPFGDEAKEAAVYEYVAGSGEVRFEVVRFELADPTHPAYPDKTFIQRVPGKGWGRKKHGARPILYRLPDVLEAAAKGRVVFVVEGEKDVHTLEEMGFTATCNPGGAGKWRDAYSRALKGAHVVILADNDPAGRDHAREVSRSTYPHAASVRIVKLPDLPKKGDVTDWLGAGHTADELKAIIQRTEPLEAPPGPERGSRDNDGNAQKGRKKKDSDPPQAALLVRLASDDLFHTPDGTAYITFERGGATCTAAIGSPRVTSYLRQIFFEAKGRPPNSQALQDARDMLRARAEFEGPEREVHLRVAGDGDCIYIDLCNDSWEIVEISSGGWRIIDASEAPIRFRRTAGIQALPHPERGGSLEQLRRHVPVQDEDAFALLLAYLVQALRPRGPYPALELTGEQGSGKTTAARIIRALVDPSRVPVRTRPREERDLVIAAENSWLPVFDNLSGIPAWLSDAFCRLSTGGGFGTRRLYSNREEELFYSLRPLVLNGIDDITTRGDLADRAITLRLSAIPRERRRTESDVWAAFEADRPMILGALFDTLSVALRRIEKVALDRLPRMADFAEWVVAAEPALPIDEGAFMRAYTNNRESAREDAVASDTVASAIVAMLDDVGEWTGKTSTLLEDLKPYLPDPDRPPRDYPTTYQAMGHHLRRIMPALRGVGVEREDDPRERSRTFILRKITPATKADEAHEANGTSSRGAESASERALSKDGSERKRTEADASTPVERPVTAKRTQRSLRPHHLPFQSMSPNEVETDRSWVDPGEIDYKRKQAHAVHASAEDWWAGRYIPAVLPWTLSIAPNGAGGDNR